MRPSAFHRLLLISVWCTCVLQGLAISPAFASRSISTTNTPSTPPTPADVTTLPLAFTQNAGQADAAARFMVRSGGGTVFFTPSEVVFALPPQAAIKEQHDDKGLALNRTQPVTERKNSSPTVVRLAWVGAQAATPQGNARQAGVSNYLLGNDAKQWRKQVATYAGVHYNDLYPGVDLHYDGPRGRLKSTYTIAPGTDAGAIRWRYTGASKVAPDERGNLLITLPDKNDAPDTKATPRTITEAAPIAWQEINGKQVPVSVGYTVADDGTVGFRVGQYNKKAPLIIDPELVYSTFVGGSSSDTAFNVRLDQAGNMYIVGETYSSDFPTKQAAQDTLQGNYDAFVTKLDPSGKLLYSTYVGGTHDDFGRGIAVDTGGQAAITGHTYSSNFPVSGAVQRSNIGGYLDGFVARLSPDGTTLSLGTYLGGSYWDQATRIAVDNADNMYVTGVTGSSDFPVTTGAFQMALRGTSDVFVAKIPANGSRLLYSTYLGGSTLEVGFGIAVNGAGNAYVVGQTESTDFPTVRPLQSAKGDTCGYCLDGFFAKLNDAGSALEQSTYLGGNNDDRGHGIVLDDAGQAHIIGVTMSTNFPVVRAVQATLGGGADAFVTTVAADGSAFVRSTYLGGSGTDTAFGIDVDAGGTTYITGETNSPNFPVETPLYPTHRGDYDAFVTQLTATGDRWLDSTYLGGTGDDRGRGIAVNRATGLIYVVGETQSGAAFASCPPDQPCAPPAQGGWRDAFVTSLAQTQPPSTPTNGRVTTTTVTSADLQWDASTDNVAVTSYLVYNGATLVGTTQTLAFTVRGLTPSTGYSFTIKAQDAAGNTSAASAPIAATTAADTESPTAPTALRATAKTGTSVSLAWNPSNDNVSVTGYNVYQDGTLLGTTTDRSYIVSGLTSSDSYTFTVKAVDGAGNVSDASNALTLTPTDTEAPTAPSNLRSTAKTATTVSLTWDAATDDVGVANYKVYNGDTLVATTTTRTHKVEGLTLNTSYTFTVKASDASGNVSAASNALTIATADTTPPTAPEQLRSMGRSTSSVDLAWNAARDDVGVEGYRVYSGAQLVGYTQSTLFTVTGLNNNTSYTFTIKAQDKAGNISPASNPLTVQTADTEEPTAPANVRSTAKTATTVSLAWDAATDNVGVIEYRVYNGTQLIGTSKSTSLNVTRLTPSTTYSFTVQAVDAGGNVSPPSEPLVIATDADTTAPTAPTNLRSTGKTGTSVNLAWDVASDNVAVARYNVYRDGTLAGTAQSSTFLVTGLTQNTKYTFTVKAADGAGNLSDASNAVTITTNDTEPPTAPANVRSTARTVTSVSLAWDAASDNVGVARYNVYRGDVLLGSVTEPQYTVNGLAPNTSYTFTVKAQDAADNLSKASAPAVVTTQADTEPPTAPANMRSTAKTGTTVSLMWDAASDNVGVKTYNVYRDGTLAGTTASTSYTVENLVRNTGYTFTVKAVDAAGNSSAASKALFITTADTPGAALLVPADYPTIQAALDAAAVGDTVLVAPGTYQERPRFNGKDVTLQSTDGPAVTTIDGMQYLAVDIGPGGQLIGFTVRTGSGHYGGGVQVYSTGTVIKGNIFEDNAGYNGSGAAINGNGASPLIDSNIFRNNSSGTQTGDGVISFYNRSSPVITNNIFEDNQGAAIALLLPEGYTPVVANNTIVRNRVGVRVDARTPTSLETYRNNIIANNTIGLLVDFGSAPTYPTWEHNLVFGNTTNYSGIPDQTGTRGNVSVDPLLVDAAKGDYHLRPGSPAIDAAQEDSCPAADFSGVRRPQGAACDIGAFEYAVPGAELNPQMYIPVTAR